MEKFSKTSKNRLPRGYFRRFLLALEEHLFSRMPLKGIKAATAFV